MVTVAMTVCRLWRHVALGQAQCGEMAAVLSFEVCVLFGLVEEELA